MTPSLFLGLLLSIPSLASLKALGTRPKVVPFRALFQLAIDDGHTIDRSSGKLYVRPDGSLCLAVEQPIHQRLVFGRQELDIYYPDDHVLMRGRPKKVGTLPPMIDALILGFLDPGSLVAPLSKVLDQKRDDATHTLTTRWSLEGPDGKSRGQLLAVEARDGVERLDLMTDDGRLMGRYDFGQRQPLGRAEVPTRIDVLHRRPGVHDRTDHWSLSGLAPEAQDEADGISCSQHPADTPVKDLPL